MKKVMVVSGGSDGLGKEIAKSFSVSHEVIILSSNEQKLQSVAQELKCDYRVCDVSNYEDIRRAVASIKEKYQRIDCLINNAGLWIEGALEENDATRIQEVINVNTTGVILLTKEVVPLMKEQKTGLIINVISQAGIYAKAERSVYTASKWAITGFTKSIQPELAKFGLKVTGLYPGKIETKIFEKMGIKKSMEDALKTSEVIPIIEFLLSAGQNVVFPEIDIKNIKN